MTTGYHSDCVQSGSPVSDIYRRFTLWLGGSGGSIDGLIACREPLLGSTSNLADIMIQAVVHLSRPLLKLSP